MWKSSAGARQRLRYTVTGWLTSAWGVASALLTGLAREIGAREVAILCMGAGAYLLAWSLWPGRYAAFGAAGVALLVLGSLQLAVILFYQWVKMRGAK